MPGPIVATSNRFSGLASPSVHNSLDQKMIKRYAIGGEGVNYLGALYLVCTGV
jgi:hypothetical protein